MIGKYGAIAGHAFMSLYLVSLSLLWFGLVEFGLIWLSLVWVCLWSAGRVFGGQRRSWGARGAVGNSQTNKQIK